MWALGIWQYMITILRQSSGGRAITERSKGSF